MSKDLLPTDNSFKFLMNIAKSYTDEETKKMIIRGVASGTLRDKQDDQMSVEGLLSIQKGIEQGIFDEDGNWSRVPLRSGHRGEWDDILGEVVKAELDSDNNLWIEAELDEDNSRALDLYKKLVRKSVQLGLSVRGGVSKYQMIFNSEIQKSIMRFDGIRIQEISVTQKPVYPTPYFLAIAKSLLTDPTYQIGIDDAQTTNEGDSMTKDISKSDETRPHGDANPSNTEKINMEGALAENQNQETLESNLPNQELQDAPEGQGQEQENDVLSEPQEVDASASSPDAPVSDASEVSEKKSTSDYAPLPTPVTQEQVSNSQPENTNQDVSGASALGTDPVVTQLQASFDTLSEAMTQMSEQLKELSNESKEVQKAEPESIPEIQKSTPERSSDEALEAAVARAVTATLTELGITKFTEDFEAVKSQLSELSVQPNDRSMSVRKAKTDDSSDESDPFVRYEKNKETEPNSIRAALEAASKN